jgi:hypothetical protein
VCDGQVKGIFLKNGQKCIEHNAIQVYKKPTLPRRDLKVYSHRHHILFRSFGFLLIGAISMALPH